VTSCDHCEAIRAQQRKIAWGGQPLTGRSHVPAFYDGQGDPGTCPCACHDVWRQFNRGTL
jgi:hypothetical protein